MAVKNVTDCPICFEELNDPRFLPCHHTFCYQCVADLRSRYHRPDVPCPLCRVTFNVQAADLRKNTYVEELARLRATESRMREELEAERTQLAQTEDARREKKERLESTVKDLQRDLSAVKSRELRLQEQQRKTAEKAKNTAEQYQKVRNVLEATKTSLKVTEDSRQEAVDEKRRLYTTLAETEEKLDELDKRSSQAKRRLESRVGKLERKLSHAQSREQCLLEQQRETVNQVTDAQCRHEAAKIEAERHQKARSDAEASLETEKQSRRNLHQQLERTQRENSEQANTLQLELGQSKQEITRLTDQLAMANLELDRQEDYRMAHAEGLSYVFSFLTHSSGDKDVTGLTIGLATLPKVHPEEPLVVRNRDGRPPRGPPGSALLLCVCSGCALLGDLLAVSRSVERDFPCSVDLS